MYVYVYLAPIQHHSPFIWSEAIVCLLPGFTHSECRRVFAAGIPSILSPSVLYCVHVSTLEPYVPSVILASTYRSTSEIDQFNSGSPISPWWIIYRLTLRPFSSQILFFFSLFPFFPFSLFPLVNLHFVKMENFKLLVHCRFSSSNICEYM